jgi:hypothetical protein
MNIDKDIITTSGSEFSEPKALRDNGVLQVFQPKVNKYKKVFFSDEGQYLLFDLE